VADRAEKKPRPLLAPWTWSLKWKIPATIGVVIVAAILVFYFRLRGWHEKRLEHLVEVQMGAALTMVNCSFESQMLSAKFNDVASTLESLAALDSIHHVRIFDPSGTIWASSRAGDRGAKVEEAEMRSFREGVPFSVVLGEGPESTPVRIVTVPIRLREECKTCHSDRLAAPPPSEAVGSVSPFWIIPGDSGPVEIAGILSFGVVPESIAGTWREEWAIIRWNFLAVILLFATSLPLALWWMVTRRVVDLETSITEAREGNLAARASASPADEIGTLGETFNQLLDRLAKARRELEEAHHQQIYHLERLSTVGELAARVAHEIKNPIAGIGLGIKMLQNADLPEETSRETAKEIQHQIQRLNTVVQNLLSFSRSQPTRFEPCSVHEILNHLESFMGMEDQEKGTRLVIEHQNSMPDIQGDAKLIEQALLNLVLNAQQAEAKTVRIEARWKTQDDLEPISTKSPRLQQMDPLGGAHVITVTDDGPGIPKSQLDEIWKPFFTTKREGTGLGLAIVRHIVHDHGGDILVESEEGTGTTFTLVFPAKKRMRSTDNVEVGSDR